MADILNRVVKYSIYVLVFLLPLFILPFSFEVFEYSKQYLLFFLTSFAFFAWIAKQVFYDGEIRFKKSPIDYLVLGFLFTCIISAIFSLDKSSSIFGLYGRFSNGLIGLLSLGALYFLITNNVSPSGESLINADKKPITTDKKSEKIGHESASISGILKVFLWSAGAVMVISYFSVFGLWVKINSLFSLPQIMLQRTFNPLGGSLEGLAVFLSVVAALLVGLLLSKTRNIFYWILLLAISGLLVIIDFTPAWIILLTTMVLFAAGSLLKRIFRENTSRLLLPIFLIIISAAFIIWQPLKMNLPQEQVLPQSISWQVSIKSAADSVKSGFLGSGFGTFHYDFAKYKSQSFNQSQLWQIRFDRAGSHLAELLGSIGFLGFLVYLGLAGFVLIISWLLMGRYFSGLPLAMAFAALLASQLVYYQNTSLAFIFWTILGLSAVSWQIKNPALMQEKKFSLKSFPELSLLASTLIIILGVVILSLYFYGVKYYLADMNYSKALSTLGESRIKNLEKAVNLNPGLSQYRTLTARTYLAEALLEMQKSQGQQDSAKIQLLVSKAIDQARIAVQLQPNLAANWENLGILYREIRGVASGATEWGIKSFEKAIDLEPANPVLHTELGRLYSASGDKEKARDTFNKAIEQKSDYEDAIIQLALLLEQESSFTEAVGKIEQIVKNNPFNVEALFHLGRLYFNQKRAEEAIALFRSIIILVPNHSNAHYSLGVAYVSQGKTQLAIQEFEKVLELNPGSQDVQQKLRNLRGY